MQPSTRSYTPPVCMLLIYVHVYYQSVHVVGTAFHSQPLLLFIHQIIEPWQYGQINE